MWPHCLVIEVQNEVLYKFFCLSIFANNYVFMYCSKNLQNINCNKNQQQFSTRLQLNVDIKFDNIPYSMLCMFIDMKLRSMFIARGLRTVCCDINWFLTHRFKAIQGLMCRREIDGGNRLGQDSVWSSTCSCKFWYFYNISGCISDLVIFFSSMPSCQFGYRVQLLISPTG